MLNPRIIIVIKYLDISKIRMPKSVPRYIHADMAFAASGDALGLAMSGVKQWVKAHVEVETGDFEVRSVPVVETDFVMRLVAAAGDRIPFVAVRKLVFDLIAKKFKIAKFTADYRSMSEDTLQIFIRRGVPAGYFSVDRTKEPFEAFRDIAIEGRWICHRVPILHFELKNLEDTGTKIDHPEKVSEIVMLKDGGTKSVSLVGSKDLADPVAATVAQAAKETAPSVPEEDFAKLIKSVVKSSPMTEDVIKLLGVQKVKPTGKAVKGASTKQMQSLRNLMDRLNR